ncbi:MAG: glycosyltransferase, partial [Cytophagales bacterium]|nr:glycosyltransferase [Cytophagales bacterium]
EKPMLRRAHIIHCIGESEVQGPKRIFPGARTALTPYGFTAGTRDAGHTNAPDEKFIVGFVGRLDIYTKGLDLLLEVFAGFVGKYPDSQLWIVGDSAEKKALEAAISIRKLHDRVILWGSKFGQEKSDLMHQMHIFAHPSRNEGLPASIIEASSMGIPCLVTQATNMGDPVRRYQCGMVVENENVNMLYEAMVKLRTQWDIDRLRSAGERAKSMVLNEYNWSRIVGEFDKLYSVS